MVQLLGFEGQRCNQLLVQAVGHARPQHAHHRVRRSIDADGLADNVGVRAKPLPQLVHQDDFMFLAQCSFLGQKVAAKEKIHSQHLVHARRSELPLNILRLIFRGQVEAGSGERAQAGEDGVLILPVGKVAGGNAVAVALNFGPHHDQLVRLGIRHGRQQRSVDHGKDCRVGADSQSQRQHSSQGKYWRLD